MPEISPLRSIKRLSNNIKRKCVNFNFDLIFFLGLMSLTGSVNFG